jgi:predicted TIM-barrel fold metal-dependent hydrolase
MVPKHALKENRMPSNQFAVDCHLHAHWPQRYPYLHPTGSRIDASNLAASPAGLFSTLKANGITHCLLVQAGAYAFDNRAMLDVIAASNGAIKAVAALPLDAPDEVFIGLKSRGIVGIRLSVFHDPHRFESDKMDDFLRRCRKHDYWVEIFAPAASWPVIIPQLVRSEVRVIAEHVGWPLLSEGIQQPGFQALLKFGRTNDSVIKLSGGFRISWSGEPYEDVRPYVIELLNAFGTNRCIWGSDWPFLNPDTGPAKRPMKVTVDYRREFDVLRSWVTSEDACRKILWDNPARLFGFAQSASIRDLQVKF